MRWLADPDGKDEWEIKNRLIRRQGISEIKAISSKHTAP